MHIDEHGAVKAGREVAICTCEKCGKNFNTLADERLRVCEQCEKLNNNENGEKV